MCGRYMVISSPEAIRRLFGYPEQPNFPPRYNVAPTQPMPIVRIVEGQRQFALVRWGLIPPWVKDPRKFALLINARGESVNDRVAFRSAMRRRRCLIPADGFYAWKDERGRKRPYCNTVAAGGGTSLHQCAKPLENLRRTQYVDARGSRSQHPAPTQDLPRERVQ
jgi:putative SOS response-associated peptidase YedK